MRATATCALVVACSPCLAPLAHADDREASLELQVGPAAIHVNPAEADASDTMGGGWLGFRGTYGLTDTFAAELHLGALMAGGTTFYDLRDPGSELAADLRWNTVSARSLVGLTARLGVRYIPTVSILAGYQHTFVTEGTYIGRETSEVVGSVGRNNMGAFVVGAGVGFDYRLGARWVVGASLQVVHGFTPDGEAFDSIELPIRIAWYSYPEMWLRRD
jgi:hypothetical protein